MSAKLASRLTLAMLHQPSQAPGSSRLAPQPEPPRSRPSSPPLPPALPVLPAPLVPPVPPVLPVPPVPPLPPAPPTLKEGVVDFATARRIYENNEELSKHPRFKHFKFQKSLPVTYETFTTHANTPTGTHVVFFPLTVEAFHLRAAVIEYMGLQNHDARNLVYSLTGDITPAPPPKPFTTLDDVEDALKIVLDYASRAKKKPKGLKIMNKDPVAKSGAVMSLVDRCRREDKEGKKAAASKRELKRMEKDPSVTTLLRPPNDLVWDNNKFATDRIIRPYVKREAKPLPKVEKKGFVKSKFGSRLSPINVDLNPINTKSTPIKLDLTPTPTPSPKAESPEYISSSDELDHNTILVLSNASTRSGSPCEDYSSSITLLFEQLQSAHPDLDFLSYMNRLDALGIRFVYELADSNRDVQWLVDYARMPVQEATLVCQAAHDTVVQGDVGSSAGPSYI
ncbi:hypothetical protein FRC06_006980 [Ceratobasidium sp. 370]|nr:hypothetical protein FRC06_006980 [Ceratobasidium sp. 370]